MSKISLQDVSSGYNLQAINNNFVLIASALNDDVLYRDNPVGEPNEMVGTDLDMNGGRIINLGQGVNNTDAARISDVQQAISGLPSANLIPFTPYLYATNNTVQGAIQQVVDKTLSVETEITTIVNQLVADLANTSDPTKGDAKIGVQQPFTGSVARTQHQYNAAKLQWQDFCVGNGIVDDTVNVQNYLNAVGQYGTADFSGGTFKIYGVRTLLGQAIVNGTFTLTTDANQFNACFVPRKNTRFIGCVGAGTGNTGTATVAKYNCFIYAGNSIVAAPFNTPPENGVQVLNCSLSNFTANVMIAGANTDATPIKWKIVDNDVDSTVGYTGQSEGYVFLLSPAKNCLVQGNMITNTKRHAIYLAGEATRNVVNSNIIDTIDNVAIQSNTYTSQNYASENIISNNSITNVTKLGGYSYNSSVGIGVYGKHVRAKVTGNTISNFVNIGIDMVGVSGDTTRNGVEGFISNNTIDCSSAVTLAAIEISDMGGCVAQGNKITMSNSTAYPFIIGGSTSTSTAPIVIKDNDITGQSGTVAFRTLWAGQRVVITRNTLSGISITNRILNTGSDVVIDEFQSTSYYNTDADFTHTSFGPNSTTDSKAIRWATANTVTRTITLAERGQVAPNMEFHVQRTAGSGTLQVVTASSPGSPLKVIASGQWATFIFNQAGAWEEKAFGSL